MVYRAKRLGPARDRTAIDRTMNSKSGKRVCTPTRRISRIVRTGRDSHYTTEPESLVGSSITTYFAEESVAKVFVDFGRMVSI